MKLSQYEIEEAFSKHNRNATILEELEVEEWFNEEVEKGTQLIQEWLADEYYESKQIRLAKLSNLKSIADLVRYYFIQSTTFYVNMPLVSAGAMIAHKLDNLFDTKAESIKTTVELLAVLIPCDMYKLYRNEYEQYCIESRIVLSDETLNKLNQFMYLPPLIEPAQKLTKNNSSAYKTIKRDSLILGNSMNYHDGNISLDVLNTLNQTKLVIDYDFIDMVHEEPSEHTDKSNWDMYVQQRDFTYDLLKEYDYVILSYKPDKRGRVYSQGYHINPQGNSYHKAMLTLYETEVVPLDY